jgi:hypothetical protein
MSVPRVWVPFARADASRARLPRPRSWEANSYGYHGDDGRKFAASPRGDAYGPTWYAAYLRDPSGNKLAIVFNG